MKKNSISLNKLRGVKQSLTTKRRFLNIYWKNEKFVFVF